MTGAGSPQAAMGNLPSSVALARPAVRMTEAGPRGRADLGDVTPVLRLLLDGAAPAGGIDAEEWTVLLRTAERNAVLLRLAERLAEVRISTPGFFAEAVAREQRRVAAAIALIHAVSHACTANGIHFLFPKAVQHWPDMGDDLDLLVLSRSLEVDRRITEGLRAAATDRDFSKRIAGSSGYLIDGCPPLDIQHGRLGAVGEHIGYPAELIRNRRRVIVDGTEVFAASPEDQVVLQGLQRVYGRLGIQLCDLIHTMVAVRRDGLDWDYIIHTAGRVGVLPGLSCYLSYVEQLHRSLYRQDLLPPAARPALLLEGWGRIEFRGGQYRYPTLRVNGRLYGRQLATQLAAGHWEGAGRVCLIPFVGALRAARRLTRRSGRGGAR